MTIKGKIGCEIECFIKKTKYHKLIDICSKNNWRAEGDGSIRNYDSNTETSIEFKVGVYDILDKNIMVKKLQEVYKLIRVNSSCGLHIHISFEKIEDYYKLLKWEFVKSFQEGIKKLFTSPSEVRRLSEHYCKFYKDEIEFNNDTDTQLSELRKGGNRYHSINFNAFNLYKTIEFRVFPATNKISDFKKYLNFLLKTIEKYLKKTKVEPVTLNFKYKAKINNSQEPVLIREIITKEEKLNPNSINEINTEDIQNE